MLGDFQSNLDPVVVHIGHQRNGATLLPKRRSNLGHGLGMAERWSGHANDLASSLHKPEDPSHGPLDIKGVLVDHGLNNDRMFTADRHITHHHSAGDTAVDLGVVTPIQGSH